MSMTLASQLDLADQYISLPLPAEVPLQFRMLPEYLFDNVVEYYDFLAQYVLRQSK